MIESDCAAEAATFGAAGQFAGDAPSVLPAQPKTLRETGLEQQLVLELIAKAIFLDGKTHLPVLAGKLRLSVNVLREVLEFMLAEQLLEVGWRGASDIDVQYQLTTLGKQRAADYLARCRYLGPAPVTLEAYRSMVLRQSLRRVPEQERLGAAQLEAEFIDEPYGPGLREAVGAAMHAGRSLLLYGPSGGGKSTLARKLGRLLGGAVALPYAIVIDQHIVQLYDPLLHLAPAPQLLRPGARAGDARWLVCQRPVVAVGAELSAELLELHHDAASNLYQAPPHLKANNGIFIIDDLGRQRIGATELLNRWIGPLDAGVDQLALQGGHKVTLPFDAMLVFSTNLAPGALLDASALRRIGYKVHVGALSEANYRKLFRHQCKVVRIACDEAALSHLVQHLHGASATALLACVPRELLVRIVDFANYAGAAPRLCAATLEQAWRSLFDEYVLDGPTLADPLTHNDLYERIA